MQVKSGLHFKIFTYPKVEQVGDSQCQSNVFKTNVDGTYFTSFSTLSNYIVHSQSVNLDLGEKLILH